MVLAALVLVLVPSDEEQQHASISEPDPPDVIVVSLHGWGSFGAISPPSAAITLAATSSLTEG